MHPKIFFFFSSKIFFKIIQGSYKVLKVLEVLEYDFLKFKSWKTLENSHIYEKVLEILKGSIYCGGRSKRQTQWAWRQASERLLFNRNNKTKCPKGMKCPKETGDLVSSLCCAGCEGGVVFWKEGSR